MKQVEVQILDQAYVLGCPEGSEAQLDQAVAKVDQAMRQIRESGKLRSRERIAVLAAINLTFDQLETEASQQNHAHLTVQPEQTQQLKNLLARLESALGAQEKKKGF